MSAAIVSLVSCNTNEIEIPSSDQTAVQLQLAVENNIISRADGATRFVAQVFSDQTYTTPANVFDNGTSSSVVSASGTIDIIISPTQEYYFLLWADDGQTYDVSNLKYITLADDVEKFTEAWQSTLSIINGEDFSYAVTLTRAVAKVELVESIGFSAESLSVTCSGFPAFNVAIGSTTGDACEHTVTYEFDETIVGSLNGDDPLYVFAPINYANVCEFYFASPKAEFEITNIPLQANYVTTITGNYESETPKSTLTIGKEDYYENDERYVTINDPILEAAILEALGKESGEIITSDEALTLTSLDVYSMDISDMTGIERFTNLETLNCYGNSFTTIDVSALNNLSIFKTHNNTNLTEIIYPSDPSCIVTLYVHNTGISELDLTVMTKLNYLSAYDLTKITTLDFRNCSSISKNVYCARCYDLETVYLTASQSALAWNFKSITECSFIVTDTDGNQTTYASGELSSFTWE